MSHLRQCPAIERRTRASSQSGFTITELVVAISLGMIVVAGFYTFMSFASKWTQGITQQARFADKAGRTVALIQQRIRAANTVSNDSAGTTLMLSFDENPMLDSDGDGKAYNDTNHFEIIQFRSPHTNALSAADNYIYYKTNSGSAAEFVLLTNVRKLPNLKVFSVTNTTVSATVLINFGILDEYTSDNYQAIEIMTQASLRNRLQ